MVWYPNIEKYIQKFFKKAHWKFNRVNLKRWKFKLINVMNFILSNKKERSKIYYKEKLV